MVNAFVSLLTLALAAEPAPQAGNYFKITVVALEEPPRSTPRLCSFLLDRSRFGV
jgi:hypothetical protein